jgi:hypothetical protein
MRCATGGSGGGGEERTSGKVQTLTEVAADREILVKEDEGIIAGGD